MGKSELLQQIEQEKKQIQYFNNRVEDCYEQIENLKRDISQYHNELRKHEMNFRKLQTELEKSENQTVTTTGDYATQDYILETIRNIKKLGISYAVAVDDKNNKPFIGQMNGNYYIILSQPILVDGKDCACMVFYQEHTWHRLKEPTYKRTCYKEIPKKYSSAYACMKAGLYILQGKEIPA